MRILDCCQLLSDGWILDPIHQDVLEHTDHHMGVSDKCIGTSPGSARTTQISVHLVQTRGAEYINTDYNENGPLSPGRRVLKPRETYRKASRSILCCVVEASNLSAFGECKMYVPPRVRMHYYYSPNYSVEVFFFFFRLHHSRMV
jgi:hypothetical protein